MFELHTQKNLVPPTFVFSTAATLIRAPHILLQAVKVTEGRVLKSAAAVSTKTRVGLSYGIHAARDALHLDSCWQACDGIRCFFPSAGTRLQVDFSDLLKVGVMTGSLSLV